MDSSQDFKSMQEGIQRALVTATKTVNELANQDLQFQRTVNPSVGSQLDQHSTRLLQISNGLLKSAGNTPKQRLPSIEDADDIDISWKGIVDVIDSLLEKADTCLDEYTGLIKRKEAPTSVAGSAAKRPKASSSQLDWSLKRANIIKPQNAFERQIDNFSLGPWMPLLTSKPHALIPLEESLATIVGEHHMIQYKHPYETEILSLKYPAVLYQHCEPIRYLPIESTSAVWVDTYEGVLEMLDELKNVTEIAVDLEHHDYRSYAGLLSLMQISTREKDWIVDTLRPWRHKLEVLNQVFTDPNIVKVFHGAYMDIIWLQRDLGLYVVGLFDTHFASDALGYQAKSLAHLLKKFADFEAEKKYQLADWRIRPLPQEMLYYARSDTHYLLYIFDMVRNELVEQPHPHSSGDSLVEWVIHKSREVSLQRYENPITDPEAGSAARAWFNFLIKTPQLKTAEHLSVYKAVYKWRDQRARQEDENPTFIMPQMVLSDISKIVPIDQKALWSLLGNQARSLRPHLDDLFRVIQEAKESSIGGPSVFDALRADAAGSSPRRSIQSTQAEHAGASFLTPQATQPGLPVIQDLRSERSQLFGELSMSSVHDRSLPVSDPDRLSQIAIPWLQFVQNVHGTDGLEKQGHESLETSLDSARLQTVDEDDVFTLKSGRKRKAYYADDPTNTVQVNCGSTLNISEGSRNASESDQMVVGEENTTEEDGVPHREDSPGNQTLEEARELKKARRKEKREKKRAAQEARQSSTNDGAEGQAVTTEDEPFDYAKARSVLHAAGSKGDRRGNGPKIFDPYAKMTGGAPQAAKPLNYEKAGKTATFKK